MTEPVSRMHYSGKNAELYEARRIAKPKWREEQEIVGAYIKSLPKQASVLDVPFGTGRFTDAYVDASLLVTGLDISGDMLKQARQLHGTKIDGMTLVTGSADDLPLEDKSFDYIICNRFLKWLPSADSVQEVASEFRRVCRREMFVQLKIREIGRLNLGITARRLLKRALTRTDSGRPTMRYTWAEVESFFARDGWEIAEVVKAPNVGAGVTYLRVRHKGET